MTDLIIRKSVLADIPQLLEIFTLARNFMARTGNPNQWDESYPNEEILRDDIRAGESYVCLEDNQIVATFVLRSGEEPTYQKIYQGAWLSQTPYVTIHRIASNGQVKGILHAAMEFALEQHKCIRIDTHRDNVVMQNAIKKEGFRYCGIIYCWENAERLAYQYE